MVGGVKRDLSVLAGREHDLVVVGGGIYGAAAAWDAAERGLAVALVEAGDFGSGVSWNSLKTIHGGFRHLQRGDLGALRESMRDRRALLRIAPEVVRLLPFLVPAYGHGVRGREALAVAARLNDLLTLDRSAGLPPGRRIPAGRLLGRAEVLGLVPDLARSGLTGGLVWTDAQVTSSERLLLGFLHAAASRGASLANHLEVTGLLRCRERVAGVRARDRRAEGEIEVRARLVLNATGPGVDRVLTLAGIARPPIPLLEATNLVLRRPVVREHAVGALGDGRYLFLVPWRDRSILGTAYGPAGSGARAEQFLEEAQRAFPWASLRQEDVALVHHGLVPGSASGLWTRNRILDHEPEDAVPGLVSVVGVKYTTARETARRLVDLAFRRLGRAVPPCRTAEVPLAGLVLPGGSLRDQARHVARQEMALGLADAVLRRLDLGTGERPAHAELAEVEQALAEEHGWDPARRRLERAALESQGAWWPPVEADRMAAGTPSAS